LNIGIVLGTRPEIIKLAQIIKLLSKQKKHKMILIHTGQHYAKNLSGNFFKELGLINPHINLGIGSKTAVKQINEACIKLEKLIEKKKIDLIVAEGDTNAVLSAALSANKTGAEFAHVEAGLRSFDREMPEEINRMVADILADYNFAPTKVAVKNLKNSEAKKESVYLTGNTIVEVTRQNLKKAKKQKKSKTKVLEKLGLKKNEFVCVTLHRKETTCEKKRMNEIINALKKIREKIVFPIHPRTVKMLKKFKLWNKIKKIKKIKLIKPLSYFEFLNLCSDSKLIITDSGGIQEEATIYKKPVIITRTTTERPEIIGSFGTLTGYDSKKITKEYEKISKNYKKIIKKLQKTKSPFGDGKASQRIVKILLKRKKN
jgi:UDP-N-acetylglucosamine 2-epimerase (non-hydrolysing)